jgi:hypothetical protein
MSQGNGEEAREIGPGRAAAAPKRQVAIIGLAGREGHRRLMMHPDRRNDPAGPHQIERESEGRRAPDAFQDGIHSESLGGVFRLSNRVMARGQGSGAEARSEIQPFGDGVHGIDRVRAELPGCDDGHEPDRSAAQDRANPPRPGFGEAGGVVSGGQDVAQEERRFVRDFGWERRESRVGKRDPHQLRLAPVEPRAILDPPEQLTSHAAGGQPQPAEAAVATARGKGRHDTIPQPEPPERGPRLDDLAHELVAHDGALVEAGLPPMPDVEIGSADGGHPDADDRIGGREQDRIGDAVASQIVNAVKGEGVHGGSEPDQPASHAGAVPGPLLTVRLREPGLLPEHHAQMEDQQHAEGVDC